jgi:hypothetical protein
VEFDGIQFKEGSSRRFSIQKPSIFARNAIVLSTFLTVGAGDRASPGRLPRRRREERIFIMDIVL